MVNWALYDGCKEFGVTAHIMNELIDNGQIIKVVRFKIDQGESIISLIDKTKKYSLNLFREIVSQIINNKVQNIKNYFPKNNEKWNGIAKTIKEVDEISQIKLGIKKEELEKRIKAFHLNDYPIYIEIEGKRFIYQIPK